MGKTLIAYIGKFPFLIGKVLTTHANEKCVMANLVFVNFVCYLMDGFVSIPYR